MNPDAAAHSACSLFALAARGGGGDGPALGVLGSLAAAVYTCDAQGRIGFFNEAAAELWGRRPEVGKDLWCGSWRIYTPEGTPLPAEECPMAVALREGRSVRGVEIVVERPDGVRRHVLPHPDPIRDASGRVVGSVNLLVDVTEEREADRAGSLLAAIVDSSEDAIISKSLEGRITSWNAGARRIFGYEPEEVVGRSITVLIPGERPAEEESILMRLRRGERIEPFETVRVAKDGRRIDVSLTVSPVRDGRGRIIGASKIARDITQQKRAAEALARSERDLADFFDNAPVGLHWVDARGTILRANKAELAMLGYGAGEYVGRCIGEFHEDQGALRELLDRLGRGEDVVEFPARMRRKDGAVLHVRISSNGRWEGGRLAHTRCFTRDVTAEVEAREALKRQQEELEKAVARRAAELEESHQRLRIAERMASLGTLSAGLGHDMGNLLLPVRVSLEALAAADLPEELRRDVERIRTSTRYLQQLANGLRMMALDPQGTRGSEPLDLGAWWQDAAAVVQNTLPRGVALRAEFGEGLWVGIARPALTQVVFNLAQNAGEALRGRADGVLRISAWRDEGGEGEGGRGEGRVLLRVADNGPGMSREVLARCMEPFFTTKTRGISTGLGLVLVAGTVREVGGTMRIESTPGEGTAFILDLPAAAAPAAERSPAAGPVRRAGVDIRDTRLRALVAAELRRLGFEVVAEVEGSALEVAVLDGSRPLSREQLRARHIVHLGEANGLTQKVDAIGASPSLTAIRSALRLAAVEGAAPGGGVPA